MRKARAASPSKPLEVKAPKPKAKQADSKTGGRRGALKESILAALHKAGKVGLAVEDFSSSTGVKTPKPSCLVQQHREKQRRYEG